MKFRKKSGIAQNQEKSGIIRKIRKCLTDCFMHGEREAVRFFWICIFICLTFSHLLGFWFNKI